MTAKPDTLLSRSQWHRSLTEEARAGTLTYERLWDAILAEESGGAGDIPESIGMDWILQHPSTFAAAVHSVTFFVVRTAEMICTAEMKDAGEMARFEGLRWWFLQRFLCTAELSKRLEGFGEHETGIDLFARLFKEFGASSISRWMKTAEALGMDLSAIGRAFVARLEAAEYRSGMADIFSDFLSDEVRGAITRANQLADSLQSLGCTDIAIADVGRRMQKAAPALAGLGKDLIKRAHQQDWNDPAGWVLRSDSFWNQLPADACRDALVVCARKCAHKLFDPTVWIALQVKLGEAGAKAILREAASHVASCRGGSFEMYSRLDPADQVKLGERLLGIEGIEGPGFAGAGTVRFLVSLCDPGRKPVPTPITFQMLLRAGIKIHTLYKAAYRMYGVESPGERAARRLLLDAGWCCGAVQVGEHDRRQEYFIWVDGLKCIGNRQSHRAAFLKPGDHVIFRLPSNVYIGCRLTFVDFVPLHPDD